MFYFLTILGVIFPWIGYFGCQTLSFWRILCFDLFLGFTTIGAIILAAFPDGMGLDGTVPQGIIIGLFTSLCLLQLICFLYCTRYTFLIVKLNRAEK
mmetsp:Transcript_22852/g.3754  ORF Transcript_22852/g.3754 Transcript_22852/m.3754 type:complete len:97 (-) Transcript_22852:113-403(-)